MARSSCAQHQAEAGKSWVTLKSSLACTRLVQDDTLFCQSGALIDPSAHAKIAWQPHPDVGCRRLRFTLCRKGSSAWIQRVLEFFSERAHVRVLEHMELRCLELGSTNTRGHECFSSKFSEVTAAPSVLWLCSQPEGRGPSILLIRCFSGSWNFGEERGKTRGSL